MCGIAGFIKRNGVANDKDKTELDGMLRRIYHRGPDDTGVCGIIGGDFENKDVAVNIRDNAVGILGFNRLSIQDLSPAGHQPMLSDDNRTVITFNGEIYNVDELKETLKRDGCDMNFNGHSDTEVILKCYKMYGIDRTLRMLNGMFSIVIADLNLKSLFIARDRIGIIPCHIMINNNRIVWASEIKAFLELSDFDRKVNIDAISDAIKFYNPNSSMYRDVENVEPGSYYSYNWDKNIIGKKVYFSFDEYGKVKRRINIEECEAVLEDCLKRQLISDAPLGVQLSGGVDSTLLAKYTSDVFRNKSSDLCGFSLVNRKYEKYSEEKWIDHAAARLKIDLHKYDFNEDVFATNFEKGIYAFERFLNVPDPVGIYTFSKDAKKYVTVLISGEGSDELAGGYGGFCSTRLYDIYENVLGQAKAVSRYGKLIPQTINSKFIMSFDSMLENEDCKRLFPQFNIDKNIQMKNEFINSLNGSNFEKMRRMFFKEELVSLLERQNKICMANSIENRVPFLDNRFVELLFTIEDSQLVHLRVLNAIKSKNKSKLYEGKYILKQMSSNIYGKEFAFRNKQAVRIPINQYIKNPLFQNYINKIILPEMKNRGLVDMKEFYKAYNNLNELSNTIMVWKSINMESWMQLFYDGRKPIEITNC